MGNGYKEVKKMKLKKKVNKYKDIMKNKELTEFDECQEGKK